ncbi:MAG TPA: hypothetical protein VK503_08930 [Candidatus Bathyarchaeia archaeon]|nr:hypothetical protein [Candidatus Bathyarchaeia archaeon]
MMTPSIWDMFGLWIGAALTVWLFSFAFKDNALYKLAEHLFVGVAAAYNFTIAIDGILKTGIAPVQQGNIPRIFALILGCVFFAKYFGKYSWVARFGPAFAIGVGLGISVTTAPEGFVLAQVKSSMLPLWTGDFLQSFTNILMTFIVLGGLTYFMFTFVPGIRGAAKKSPGTRLYDAFLKIGIYGMMIGFGALFASTIVSRVAYLIGRLTDLIASPEASIVATILVIGAIVYAYQHEKKTAVGTLKQKESRKTT